MQSKTFSRLPILVVVVASLFLLVSIVRRGMNDVPLPEFPSFATSTPAIATSTLAAAASIPVSGMISVTSPVKTPLGIIHAMIASTSADRERGLGGRTSIPIDGGMMFVFEQPGEYGFWMKDTLIPLDFIWISQDKKVAGVDTGVIPETYPKVFYPPTDISYVLELNSGGAAKWGIATGTQLVF